MPKFKKILILCPGDVVTGGPEALHHLAHLLCKMGLDARMVYTPLGGKFEVPDAYKVFNVNIGEYEDAENNLIIFPEIYPMQALKVQHAKAAIWWLSLDNFLERRHLSKIRDVIRYWKGVLRGRRPLTGVSALKNIIHFSQSHYSSDYLIANGVDVIEFFEPINARFLTGDLDPIDVSRVDEILFNPNKGKAITKRLIEKFPDWKFTPLKGFNREQLSQKFSTAKVYIDFGHHPGRDRLPREAAMHGCCVVTGLLGSAGNAVDIPIDSDYKLDTEADDFEIKFELLILNIFNQFKRHHGAFDSYRVRILSEPANFESQISKFFLSGT
jgi:hypothetical protein